MNAGPLPPVPALIPISALRKVGNTNKKGSQICEDNSNNNNIFDKDQLSTDGRADFVCGQKRHYQEEDGPLCGNNNTAGDRSYGNSREDRQRKAGNSINNKGDLVCHRHNQQEESGGLSDVESPMGEHQQRPQRPVSNDRVATEAIDTGGQVPEEGGEEEEDRGAASAASASAAEARKTARSQRHHHHHRKCRGGSGGRTRSSSSKQSQPPPSRSQHQPQPHNLINPIFVWVRQEDTRIVDVKCEDYDKRNRILLTKTAQGWRAIPRTETLVPSLKDTDNTVNENAVGDKDSSTHHHHHKSKRSRKNKVRRRSTGVQVTSDLEDEEDLEDGARVDDLESLLPSHTIKVNRAGSVTPQTVVDDVEANVNTTTSNAATVPTSDVTPLDNLLAVAELEFNQVRSSEWREKNTEHDGEHFDDSHKKTEDCDYTEEDENNIAMDDILSRLERSLQSPECTEVHTSCETVASKIADTATDESLVKKEVMEEPAITASAETETETEAIVPELQSDSQSEVEQKDSEGEVVNLVESSTADDEPTDLSLKPPAANDSTCDVNEEPTDLSIPKKSASPPPRPVSQNSEAIQSPQPSGIPAVPPSPDIVSTTVNSKSKSLFLETLLASTTKKIALNSEVTITRQSEPLDLGKCSRKSASPTVTCSEEVSGTSQIEPPPAKKFKPLDISLKNLIDVEEQKSSENKNEKPVSGTPRLLELLKNDSEPDPLLQLKQLLADPSINVPDPILIPKENFATVLMKPGTEIPKLLKERPELRLPEALAYPHIMQDPNMLVLSLHDLEAIIASRCGHGGDNKETKTDKEKEKEVAKEKNCKPEQQKTVNELANDIDVATQTAFNQMMWLPYLSQLEAMGNTSNAEFMKMLSGSLGNLPFYPPELNNVFGNSNRFPPGMPFPMQPLNYGNMLEMSMWQQAMIQADLLRNKTAMETMNNKYMERTNSSNVRKNTPHAGMNHMIQQPNKQQFNGHFYANGHAGCQNPYVNTNPYQSSSKPNHHRNSIRTQYAQKQQHHNYQQQQQKMDPSQHLYNLAELEKQHQYMQSLSGFGQEYNNIPQRREPQQKPKLSCKPFSNLSARSMDPKPDFPRHPGTYQPMDLSGIPSLASKQKSKQHYMDQMNAAAAAAAAAKASKHHEDVPEVGSTTASIEEMQDAHKYLWHPLFGSQQGQQAQKPLAPGNPYSAGWQWPGLTTASGE